MINEFKDSTSKYKDLPHGVTEGNSSAVIVIEMSPQVIHRRVVSRLQAGSGDLVKCEFGTLGLTQCFALTHPYSHQAHLSCFGSSVEMPHPPRHACLGGSAALIHDARSSMKFCTSNICGSANQAQAGPGEPSRARVSKVTLAIAIKLAHGNS